MFDRLSEDQRQVLNIVPEGHNVFITGQGGTARKNNRLLSSIFPAGEGALGNDVSVPRKVTSELPEWIVFVQCSGLIFLVARWSGHATSASMFSVFLDNILRVYQSLWDSFLYLVKLD